MDTPETNNEIPPKVSPIKPAAPGGPRPITIKLKRPAPGLRPGVKLPPSPGFKPGVKLPSQAAAATVSPKVEPVADAAPAAPVVEAAAPVVEPVVPVADEAAATVKLKPVETAPAAAEGEYEPMKTVKLKPVAAPAAPAPSATASIVPPSEAQAQAAKSKTSRISLESAVGIAPGGNEQPKTIRLKRPIGLARPAAAAPAAAPAGNGKTSRLPDDVAPQADTAAVPKTLKIKKPTAAAPVKTPGEKAMENAENEADDTFAGLTPLTDIPAPKESSVMLGVSIGVGAVAAIVIILLCLCLGSQAMGPDAGPNSLATIEGPVLPWGK